MWAFKGRDAWRNQEIETGMHGIKGSKSLGRL